jgi:endonuclease YncB( thermonuclease family)
VSLNNRRRIFRPSFSVSGSIGRFLPWRNVLLAALGGGVATLVAAASLLVHPSDAPAHAQANQQLTAAADRVAVIDGDTLRIGDHVVRLEKISAPAGGSVCHSATAGDLDCGVAAANKLASLVREGPVACTIHGADAMGRPVAACRSGGVPLSQMLVRNGWARAKTADLRSTEDAARASGVGIWRSLSGS